MSLVQPNGRPDVSNRSYPIDVRFASPVEIEFPVKHMNGTHVLLDLMPTFSLFEIAGRVETATAFFNGHQAETPLTTGTFPLEKNDSIMKTSAPAKKTADPKKRSIKPNNDAPVLTDKPRRSNISTQFQLRAPAAGSVKLAADFTDWEKSPLAMNKDDEGMWVASVSLAPGEYAYRFIVDGEWVEDPSPFQSLPNPFGTLNSVIHVR
jgi:Glycogen recognition site of AMP-activated protein kinase